MNEDRSWVGNPSLKGRWVALSPLALDDAEDLRTVAELGFFEHFVSIQPTSLEPEEFRRYVQSVIHAPRTVGLIARLSQTCDAVGTSSFMDIRADHRALEVGMTWIARRWQGTVVNPEMKLLMLRYAFEQLGAVRVQLKCDARNLRSQSAIAKLGAVREGVLRKHAIQPNGFVRDTVMFSIVDSEWPAVHAGLVARLAKYGESAGLEADLG